MVERRQKRERDAEVAREAILRAAEEVFGERGFDGARVDAIAEAAGYNKALIFHYFGDKLGLYQAAIRRLFEQNTEQISRLIERYGIDEATPVSRERVQEFIAAAVRWTFDFYRAHPPLLRMLAWEAAEQWRTFTLCHKEHGPNDWAGTAMTYLRRAQAAGIVRREIDPLMLTANVIGMGMIYLLSTPRYEMVFAWEDFSSQAALDHAREQIVALVLHGTVTDTETN
jgi:TetR/AcrR family transcriptional regulator